MKATRASGSYRLHVALIFPAYRQVAVATCLMLQVEALIRRRRLDELARVAGLQFDPSQHVHPAEASSELVLSPLDVRVLRLVARLYRWWPFTSGGSCLRQCLVAGRLLRYRSPVLRIGVRRRGLDGDIAAHAWLEFDGIAVDPSAREFASLTRTA